MAYESIFVDFFDEILFSDRTNCIEFFDLTLKTVDFRWEYDILGFLNVKISTIHAFQR